MKKIAMLLVVFLVGCQTQPETIYPETRETSEISDVKTALIGHWERQDDNKDWDEYFTEDTMIKKRKGNGVEIEFEYEILSYDEEAGTVEIKLFNPGDSMYVIETYTFTDEKRVTIKYGGEELNGKNDGVYIQDTDELLSNTNKNVFTMCYVDDKTKP
jgi:hypothetical protein